MTGTGQEPHNGYPLKACAQLRDDRWVIVVDRGAGTYDRYVTAFTASLDSPSWDSGHYFSDYVDALYRMAEELPRVNLEST